MTRTRARGERAETSAVASPTVTSAYAGWTALRAFVVVVVVFLFVVAVAALDGLKCCVLSCVCECAAVAQPLEFSVEKVCETIT